MRRLFCIAAAVPVLFIAASALAEGGSSFGEKVPTVASTVLEFEFSPFDLYSMGQPQPILRALRETPPVSGIYYDQLDDDSKTVYNTLYSHYKDGSVPALVPGTFDSNYCTIPVVYRFQSTTCTLDADDPTKLKLSTVDNNMTESWIHANVITAFFALCADHPEMGWLTLDDSKIFTKGTATGTLLEDSITWDVTVSIGFRIERYTNVGNADQMADIIVSHRSAIEARYPDILTSPAYKKAEYLNEYVCSVASYDTSAGNNTAPITQTAYSALVEPYKTVCAGYARAYQLLCQQYGVPCTIVMGLGYPNGSTTGEKHMWNYVRLSGAWYGVDCTWNDQTILSRFLLKGSEGEFSLTHKNNGNWFNPSNRYGQDIQFYYPILNNADFCFNDDITGDINKDGEIDTKDLDLLLQHISKKCFLNNDHFPRADMNSDGLLTIEDALEMCKRFTVWH